MRPQNTSISKSTGSQGQRALYVIFVVIKVINKEEFCLGQHIFKGFLVKYNIWQRHAINIVRSLLYIIRACKHITLRVSGEYFDIDHVLSGFFLSIELEALSTL